MHFTVTVAGENPDAELAPFQENNMDDCPEKFLEFVDLEYEYQDDYDNNSGRFIKTSDGRILSRYDDEFAHTSENGISRKYIIPEDCVEVDVPFKEVYDSVEDYAMKAHSNFDRDPKEGRYGYWSNPNSKWDWYQLGGRWSGLLKAKDGVVGGYGETALFDDNKAKSGYYDQLLKSEIDFEGMRADKKKDAIELFEKITLAVAGRELPKSWAEMLAESNGDVQATREQYNNHPVVVSLRDANLIPFLQPLNEFLCDMNEEKFVSARVSNTYTTHALLYNGIWTDAYNFSNEAEFLTFFNEAFANMPDDTLISVYDCHI